MYKELIICVIILSVVITGHVITQNNIRKSVHEISEKLNGLKKQLIQEENNSKTTMEEIEKLWEEKYKVLAYYVEHDELEKVQTELVKLKASIEVKEYALGVEELDNAIFILEHIQDKNALQIVNIF